MVKQLRAILKNCETHGVNKLIGKDMLPMSAGYVPIGKTEGAWANCAHKFAGFFEGRCFEGTMWSNVRSLVCAVFLELRRRSYVELVVYLRG